MAFDNEHVGRRIRSLRVDKGWTCEQLAERSGIPVSTIQSYERGKRVMRLDNAVKLAEVFGCAVDRISCRID